MAFWSAPGAPNRSRVLSQPRHVNATYILAHRPLISCQNHAEECTNDTSMRHIPFTATFPFPSRVPQPLYNDPLQSTSSKQNIIFHPVLRPSDPLQMDE
jgi:hypothetical protein